jgi:hypothetical protein
MARIDDIVRLIQGQASIILPAYTQAISYNSGMNDLLISQSATPTAGQENVFLQLGPKNYNGFPTASLAVNVSGQPDVLQVVLESDASTAARSVWTAIDFSMLMSVLASMNVEMWIYLRANGTVPGLADLTAGNLVGVVLADPRHPNVGQ